MSGGVDSAVLAALAVRALGPRRVLGVTAASASLPRRELRDARRMAAAIGIRHEVVDTGEIDDPSYRANREDRCFHCRSALFSVLRARVQDRCEPRPVAVYGAIVDDLGDVRPGMRAAERFGVRAPLLEAGMDKRDVRRAARRLGLPLDEKPAAACLASRIPRGTPVTRERLARVERAEDALFELGFVQFRVRYFGERARVELDAEGNRRVLDPAERAAVVRAVRAQGFRVVQIDPRGYRQGSLHGEAGSERR